LWWMFLLSLSFLNLQDFFWFQIFPFHGTEWQFARNMVASGLARTQGLVDVIILSIIEFNQSTVNWPAIPDSLVYSNRNEWQPGKLQAIKG
jgi:hypothetical protein